MNKLILAAAIFSIASLSNAQSVDVAVTLSPDAAVSETVNITADESDKVASKTNCITQTGSHVKAKNSKACNGEPGRSYDKDDLDRTGGLTVGEMLERLDPSIQIRR